MFDFSLLRLERMIFLLSFWFCVCLVWSFFVGCFWWWFWRVLWQNGVVLSKRGTQCKERAQIAIARIKQWVKLIWEHQFAAWHLDTASLVKEQVWESVVCLCLSVCFSLDQEELSQRREKADPFPSQNEPIQAETCFLFALFYPLKRAASSWRL